MTPIEYTTIEHSLNGKGILLWHQLKRHGFMKDYFLKWKSLWDNKIQY